MFQAHSMDYTLDSIGHQIDRKYQNFDKLFVAGLYGGTKTFF